MTDAASTVPNGASYVTARWQELAAPSSPWWTRSPGVGIRMHLREVTDMALAGHQGALLDATLKRVLKEANGALLTRSRFLAEQFKATADQIQKALSAVNSQSDQFFPYGRNYATVAAALGQLDEHEDLIAIIADVLGTAASKTRDWKTLADLDELVMLLDDELVYERFSRAWRYDLAVEVARRVGEGHELAEAIKAAYTDAKTGWPRDIQWLFPVEQYESRSNEVLTNRYLDEQSAGELLTEVWQDVPDGLELLLDHGCFEVSVPDSRDLESSLERAEDWLDRQTSLWKLQGGRVQVLADAYWFDKSEGTTGVLRRPEPLNLLPRNLAKLNEELVGEPSSEHSESALFIGGLRDAIIQLAQARASARGAALSDLWMVAEAVFAGAAAETRAEAAGVMSEIAQVVYPEQLLGWFADEFERLGVPAVDGPAAGESRAGWALDVIVNHTPAIFAAISTDENALLYVRLKRFTSWAHTRAMEDELTELGDRMRRVADRAYLVRNFFVHRAQPYRATALAATLPVFADLVRESLGFVTTGIGDTNEPIQAAKLAVMRVARVASVYGREKPGSPDLLRQHLGI